MHWCIIYMHMHTCMYYGMHRYMAYISLVPTSFSSPLSSPVSSPLSQTHTITHIGLHTWHVHTLPIDQTRDPAIQCLSSWAGPHYDPFNARGSLTGAEYQMQCTPQTPLGWVRVSVKSCSAAYSTWYCMIQPDSYWWISEGVQRIWDFELHYQHSKQTSAEISAQ